MAAHLGRTRARDHVKRRKLRRGGSRLHLLRHAALQQRPEGIAPLVRLHQPGWRCGGDAEEGAHRRLQLPVGRLHLRHLDSGDAEGPHIGQARVGAFSDHLRRHPQRRAHRGRAQ